MSGVRTPKGLFRVREPLEEVLDAGGRRLASLPEADSAAAVRKLLAGAEALARRRLTPSAPTAAAWSPRPS